MTRDTLTTAAKFALGLAALAALDHITGARYVRLPDGSTTLARVSDARLAEALGEWS